MNSRDRNLLGFRRDLLTAAAYGVRDFLFVRGDEPTAGTRSTDLTVRGMIDEARDCPHAEFRVGATARIGAPLPGWKKAADFLLVQATFDVPGLLRWREAVDFPGRLLAGVLVIGSAKMGRRIANEIREISVPERLLDQLECDPDAGVAAAFDALAEIRDSGAFDGVHLVPVRRYEEVARRLRG